MMHEMTNKVAPLLTWLAQSGQTEFQLRDSHVVEVGAYNGRNTWQLLAAGARITAIEPRASSFPDGLRGEDCRLLHGTLETTTVTPCDLIFHSGVLYHLSAPVAHLNLCRTLCNRLYLNTHTANSNTASRHGVRGEWHSEDTRNRRAGIESKAFWIWFDDLITLLASLYKSVTLVTDCREPNGRRVGIWCESP